MATSTDASTADAISKAVSDLGVAPDEHAARQVVAEAFRAAADHPSWTQTPTVAYRAFESLIRNPGVIAAYQSGQPVKEIEDQFRISRSALYALLDEHGISPDRPSKRRPRSVNHAAIRLDHDRGRPAEEIARLRRCSKRTVHRVLQSKIPPTQLAIDDLAVAESPERLRGAWNRLLDTVRSIGAVIATTAEPDWPQDRDRAAMAAAAIAYFVDAHHSPAPVWLSKPQLIASEPVSPTPEFAHIAAPLTPSVVAKFNVICDEASFHST